MSKEILLNEKRDSIKRIDALRSTAVLMAFFTAVAALLFIFASLDLGPVYFGVGLILIVSTFLSYYLITVICDAAKNLIYIRENTYQHDAAAPAKEENELISIKELF